MQIILIILLSLVQKPVFYIDADLKRAKHILNHEHGVSLNKPGEQQKLNIFDKYSKLNLTEFKYSKKRHGNHVINAWKLNGKSKLEIYQIETTLHIDTALETYIYIDSPSIQKAKKTYINADFNYRTYIINDGNKPRLTFTIDVKGDLLHYTIGKYEPIILYEDVTIGQQLPDIKEILKAIGR